MLKIKRKYSDTEESDQLPLEYQPDYQGSQYNPNFNPYAFQSPMQQPQFNFQNINMNWDNQQRQAQNDMKLKRKRLNEYETREPIATQYQSRHFPKGEELGLGTPAEFLYKNEKPVRKDRDVPLYTEEQVKRLLEERETKLRMEYDKTLQNLLQEQFQNFTKFNQDYISRQFKAKKFDNYYIS